jgi:transcription antitermination factor NusG
VLQTEGAVRFVSFLGKPAVIRDDEITVIRQFLNDHLVVQVEKITFHVNEKVRITGGPFMKLEGSVLEVKSRTVRVLLPSLGFALVAEINRSNVDRMLLARHR